MGYTFTSGTALLSSHQNAIEAGTIKSVKIGLSVALTNFSVPLYIDSDASSSENDSDALVARV